MSNVRQESIKELGKHFEVSVVKYLTPDEMRALTRKAIHYNLAGVLCSAFQFNIVKEELKGTDLILGGAVSFPLGCDTPESKAFSAKELAESGATHIDFVMNYCALKSGMAEIVERESRLIRAAVPDAVLKMILEVCFLTDDEIRTACRIAADNQIDVVKSSTGQFTGPSMEQACLIVDECHKYGLKSKIAGVKFPHAQNAYAYLLAGIDIIGTQQAFDILDGIQLLRDRKIF